MSSDQHEPPEHLDARAAAKWAELLPTLQERGDADQPGTLDVLTCDAHGPAGCRHRQRSTEAGPIVKGTQGAVTANPFLAVAEKAQRQLRQWGETLRITPKSRTSRKPSSRRPTRCYAS